jgi:hypothetical protein
MRTFKEREEGGRRLAALAAREIAGTFQAIAEVCERQRPDAELGELLLRASRQTAEWRVLEEIGYRGMSAARKQPGGPEAG